MNTDDVASQVGALAVFGILLILLLSPIMGLLFLLAWNLGLSELLAAATGWSVGNISFIEAWFSMLGVGLLRGSKTEVKS